REREGGCGNYHPYARGRDHQSMDGDTRKETDAERERSATEDEGAYQKQAFCQDQAVDAVVESIWRSRVGLNDADRPIGTFLFLGPSGVGKTELAKAISFELFDDTKKMVVLDMSDYSNETSTTKLIGVSAGYVGYGEGGTLTEPVRNKPYNVVLLDEIDHAHPSVRNILYQLLDEGRITDGKRNVVD
ncbi:Chaperone protein ClpB, partial [Dictyocoela roeselum]